MSSFRLSPQQKHLFRLGPDMAPGSARTLGLARAQGPLDIERVRQALTALAARHEILRTVFPPIPGLDMPLQTLLEEPSFELVQHEARNREQSEVDSIVKAVMHTASRHGFDLRTPPLQRLDLVDLSPTEHYLIWSQPALCGDSASLARLFAELESLLSHQPERDPEEDGTLQYADLAEWLNTILESDDAADGLRYWRKRMAEIPSLALPFLDRAQGNPFDPACVDVPLDADTALTLQSVASSFDVPVTILFEAAWVAFLSRYTDSPRLPVGTLVGGRAHKELADAVGLLARYVPIDIGCDNHTAFGELVARVAAARAEAGEWQEYFSWDQAGRKEQDKQSPYLPCLCEHIDLLPPANVAGPRLTIQHLESHSDRYQVKLSTLRHSAGYRVVLWYDAGRIERTTSVRLADSFGVLLGDLALRPQIAIGQLRLVSGSSVGRSLDKLNPRQRARPPEHSVVELIARQASDRPGEPAVICGSEQLSYLELWEQSAAIARHLGSAGIGCESVVAICCDRSVDMVAAILGVLLSGAAYVPIDPAYPADRQHFMLRDSRVKVVLAHSRLADRFAEDHQVISLESVRENISLDSTQPEIGTHLQRDQLAYVIYTSGSTGQPKGVAVNHGNLLASTAARFLFYDDAPERFLLLSSYAFDSSIVGLFWTLAAGGTLIVPEEGDEQDIVRISQAIEQSRVTHMLCLPTLYGLLIDQVDHHRMSSISTVIVAGEACPPGLVNAHFEARAGCVLVNEYGPTEATVWATAARFCDLPESGRIPIGRPVGNTCVYLLDAFMQPVPEGMPGEVFIGGPGVARGYLGRPAQTAERFVPDPFSADAGARLYRTGDRARCNGFDMLEFLGRVDHQVKIRGYRIEPEEIEARLAAHPSVWQTAVVATPDFSGSHRLIAYFSPRGGSRPSVSELSEFLRSQVPDFMIPSVFVALDSLPLMPNGKVDRKALPEPQEVRPDISTDYVQPDGPLETYLAGRWRDILHADRVGVHDNFFELGGNSIQAAIFMNRLRADLDDFVHVGKLFENPTIHRLAGYLKSAHPSTAPHLGTDRPTARDAPTDSPGERQALEQLDDLSDEQVEAMLEKFLPATQVDGGQDNER